MHDLGAQSLWYDEAFSVWLARQDLGAITARTAADIHPPLYYYGLHFWLGAAGTSEFAVRYFSLFWAVLLVPAVYALARVLARGRLALAAAPGLAALLVAISPAWVWYAQEARMYSLVTLAGVLGTLALVVSLGRAGRARSPAVGLAGLLLVDAVALYTHFYALFLVAAQALALLAWCLAAPRKRLRVALPPALALGASALLWLPWAGFAVTRLGADTSYYGGTLPFETVVRQTLALFGGGPGLPESAGLALGLFLGALGALGLGALAARREGFAAWLLGLYFLLPPLLLYAISFNRPKFHPRYLLLASPALYTLAACGVAVLIARGAKFAVRSSMAGNIEPRIADRAGPVVALAAIAVLLAGSVAGLVAIGEPVAARDDWREVAAYLRGHVGAEDGIVLMSGHASPALAYYYPEGTWLPVPEDPTLSTESVIGYSFAETLNGLAAEKRRLWLVRWQAEVVDPNDYAGELLAAKTRRLPVDRAFHGIDLQLWDLPPGVHFEAAPRVQVPRAIDYDRRIQLVGYDLAAPATPSGGTLQLTLYWQALQRLDTDYKLAVRLKDGDGHYWGRADRRPAQYFYPTTRWRPGEVVFGRVELPVEAGTPPGTYQLEAELYTETAGGNRSLNFLDPAGAPAGTAAPLGTVEVAPAPQPVLPPPATRLSARFGPVALVGAGPAPGALQQGDRFTVYAQWQAEAAPGRDYTVVAQIVTEGGETVAEARYPLGGPSYPASRWPAGARVAGRYDLLVPADAPAGSLRAEIGLAEGAGAPSQFAALYPLTVRERSRQTALPPLQRRLDLEWPELGILAGYDLDRPAAAPGDTVTLTLYWQARRPTSTSYTVFAHLLDAGNQLWGQHDSPPNAGQTPTTAWAPGEVIIDRHPIPLKPGAPKEALQIEVGLYQAATGERLRLADGTDHAIIGKVQVR